MSDLLIRGGTLVQSGGVIKADLVISEGHIVEIGPELSGAKAELDASGLYLFPGVVDMHVHFNEPGRTDWEGIWPRAAAP